MRATCRALIAASSRLGASAAVSPSSSQPLRLLVVGSGPSAFYAASRVLSHFPPSGETKDAVEVHMLERLPTPHGLVRYGVAPDHPDVKNVEHKFDEVAQDPRFHFFGNVNVASSRDDPSARAYPLANQVELSSLLPHYTHVLFAYGSSLARPLGIPGSAPGELRNVYSALDFVNWYNGHPVAHDASLSLEGRPGARSFTDSLGDSRAEHMTIVGAGNVALDVARIVLRASCAALQDSSANTSEAREALAKTDVPEPVLEALSRSRLRHVDIFARRGPAQLAFTNKELREMLSLPRIGFRPLDSSVLSDAQQAVQEAEKQGGGSPEAKSEARVKNRLLSLLGKGSKTSHEEALAAGSKTWGLNFFRAPAELRGDESGALSSVVWNVTRLPSAQSAKEAVLPSAATKPGEDPVQNTTAWGGSPVTAAAPTTGKQEETQTQMLVSSIGYRSEPIADPAEEPFDASRAVVPNEDGRVRSKSGAAMPGRYVSGWLARGPVGVIASTMYDAYSVADLLVQDHKSGIALHSELAGGLPQALAQPSKKIITYRDWMRIDEVEKERGAKLGKLREKVLRESVLTANCLRCIADPIILSQTSRKCLRLHHRATVSYNKCLSTASLEHDLHTCEVACASVDADDAHSKGSRLTVCLGVWIPVTPCPRLFSWPHVGQRRQEQRLAAVDLAGLQLECDRLVRLCGHDEVLPCPVLHLHPLFERAHQPVDRLDALLDLGQLHLE